VGYPETGKRLMEATLQAIEYPELVGIQDMGAAGLTSSSAEMAAKGDHCITLHLEKVPVSEAGISPYEMMLSETQERMLLVVEDGSEDKFLKLFEEMDLATAVIGEVTDSDRLLLYFEDELYADIPVQPLSEEAPVYILEGEKPEQDEVKDDYSNEDLGAAFKSLLSHPTLARKGFIHDAFDPGHPETTLQKSGFGAGIVRIEGTDKAVSMTLDGKSRYVYADPYNGGKEVVAQAYREIIATGATPLAMTDCLNYGSPEKPLIYNQLDASTKGMAEACDTLGTPVVSGNVSLYNETKEAGSLPTPVIGMVGLIEDVNKIREGKVSEGGAVYLVGGLNPQFHGSQLEKLIDGDIRHAARAIDLDLEFKRGSMLKDLYLNGEIHKIAPLGRGGLIMKLAQLASFHDSGMDIDIDVRGDLLFSESASNYIVVAPAGMDIEGAAEIGRLSGKSFKVQAQNFNAEYDIEEIK